MLRLSPSPWPLGYYVIVSSGPNEESLHRPFSVVSQLTRPMYMTYRYVVVATCNLYSYNHICQVMIAFFTTQSTCAYIMSRRDGYKPRFPLRKRPDPLPKALVMRFFYSERWIVTTVVYYLYAIINEIDIRDDWWVWHYFWWIKKCWISGLITKLRNFRYVTPCETIPALVWLHPKP